MHDSQTEKTQNIITNKIVIIFSLLLYLIIIINSFLLVIYVDKLAVFYWLLTYLVAEIILQVGIITAFQLKNNSPSRNLRTFAMLFCFFLGSLYALSIIIALGKDYGGITHLYLLLPIPFFILSYRDQKILLITLTFFSLFLITGFYYVYQNNQSLPLPEELKFIIFISLNIIEFFGFCASIYFFWKQTLFSGDQLEQLASYDFLTNLLNRRRFIELLSTELSKMKRYNFQSALLFLDIDHFKEVNDNYGHDKGDTILKEFTQILLNNTRASDALARWGGEEFMILFTNTRAQGPEDAAEKIRQKVAQFDFGQGIHITTSGGLIPINSEDSIDELIKKVDKLLYQAKESGRNTIISG